MGTVIEKIANKLMSQFGLVKGTNLFLGKAFDDAAKTKDYVMLSEEANLTQPTTIHSRASWEQIVLTARVVWGDSYVTSAEQANKIYSFLRDYHDWSGDGLIQVEVNRPTFIDKVHGGEKFKFIFLITITYDSTRLN